MSQCLFAGGIFRGVVRGSATVALLCASTVCPAADAADARAEKGANTVLNPWSEFRIYIGLRRVLEHPETGAQIRSYPEELFSTRAWIHEWAEQRPLGNGIFFRTSHRRTGHILPEQEALDVVLEGRMANGESTLELIYDDSFRLFGYPASTEGYDFSHYELEFELRDLSFDSDYWIRFNDGTAFLRYIGAQHSFDPLTDRLSFDDAAWEEVEGPRHVEGLRFNERTSACLDRAVGFGPSEDFDLRFVVPFRPEFTREAPPVLRRSAAVKWRIWYRSLERDVFLCFPSELNDPDIVYGALNHETSLADALVARLNALREVEHELHWLSGPTTLQADQLREVEHTAEKLRELIDSEEANLRPSLVETLRAGLEELAANLVETAGRQTVGDLTQDGTSDLSDAIALLVHLFASDGTPLPCQGDLDGESNRQLLDFNGDSVVDRSDAIAQLHHLFLGGPPHFWKREACRWLMGCPDRCAAN